MISLYAVFFQTQVVQYPAGYTAIFLDQSQEEVFCTHPFLIRAFRFFMCQA